MYNVYEAKRASEVAPGVGRLTDMAILREGKVFVVETELLEALDKAHKEKPGLNSEELDKLRKACDECTKQPTAS